MTKNKEINKKYPGDLSMKKSTFLNNSKIDGELYNYLLSISVGFGEERIPLTKDSSLGEGHTVIYKKNMPTIAEIARNLTPRGNKTSEEKEKGVSPRTVRRHLDTLIEYGFLKEEKKYWEIFSESSFVMLPKDTTDYLRDNTKPHVIKIYLYLYQRNWYKHESLEDKENWVFTYKELAYHIGLNPTSHDVNRQIENALRLLKNSGLIQYRDFVKEGPNGLPVKYKELLSVSKTVIDKENSKNVDKNCSKSADKKPSREKYQKANPRIGQKTSAS